MSSQREAQPQHRPATLLDAARELVGLDTPTAAQAQSADPTATMRALVYHGTRDVRIDEVPKPALTADDDAIVRVTCTTICGSDLHLYHGFLPELRSGDILGHEAVGVVEAVGDKVTSVRPGDRVVVSAVVACGECGFCKQGKTSLCDATNQSKTMEHLYGHRTSGLLGYSHLTGGYAGGQAEYICVPHANVNLLHLPDSVSDEHGVLVADVLCTSWHAIELAEVKRGDTVAIWGAGPIGLATAMWCKHLGAARVLVIDRVPDRLHIARDKLGCETLDYERDERIASGAVADLVERLAEIMPGGPEVCIEAAGSRYAKSWRHAAQKALYLETDAIDSVAEIMRACAKGGRVALMGDFIGYANQYPIGAQMEKGLTVRGGQLWVHKDWGMVIDKLAKGEIDPSFLITHTLDLGTAPDAYRTFDDKREGMLKVMLKPGLGQSKERQPAGSVAAAAKGPTKAADLDVAGRLAALRVSGEE